MKTTLFLGVAIALLATGEARIGPGKQRFFRMAPEIDVTHPPEKVRPPGSLPGTDAPARVVLRGWEVESITAIKRPTVAQVFPDYKGRRRVGNRQMDRSAKYGTFLLLQVRVKWATDQPPGDPIWVGKPDAILFDENSTEYPVADVLTRSGAVYYSLGMVVGPGPFKPERLPKKNDNILLYFDVESLAGRFWLQLSPGGPLVQVDQVPNLIDIITPGNP